MLPPLVAERPYFALAYTVSLLYHSLMTHLVAIDVCHRRPSSLDSSSLMALITISGCDNRLPLVHDFTSNKLGRPPLAIRRKKFFICMSVRCNVNQSLRACACCPFSTSCHPYRDNRLRSHPLHFASTASTPTPSPPQSIKVQRLVPHPTTSQCIELRIMPCHRTEAL